MKVNSKKTLFVQAIAAILFVFCFGSEIIFAQWLPAGTTSSDAAIFRTGNVGIGISTIPTEKLEVGGNFKMSGQNFYMDNTFLTLHVETGSAQDNYLHINPSGDHPGVKINQNTPRYFDINAGALRVYENGKVGIGTVPGPNTTLAVEGTIGAREIFVTTLNWPDFVFKKDYELMPIKELENYIKENKHLPDIPSEAEAVQNGVALGEMQRKLLQKVEELTLYMIELQKEGDNLQERLDAIEKNN